MRDLHSALKTSIEGSADVGGTHFLRVLLQYGKNDSLATVHARPHSYSTAGVQITDFLSLLGFVRAPCAFHRTECFCRALPESLDVAQLASAINEAFARFDKGAKHLQNCGLAIDQPEGWGYFYGKPAQEIRAPPSTCAGNGHASPKVETMKQTEDEFFQFVLTWIEGGSDKGWTTHYRAKHMPLRADFESALTFLGGFRWFPDCPQFDFEGCWWRFTAYQSRDDGIFDGNAELAHSWFDAHAKNFSTGICELLEAHTLLRPFGLTFLPSNAPVPQSKSRKGRDSGVVESEPKPDQTFDVAVSFAGTERQIAEEIATRVREAGFRVFYDNFYPEQLWGEDLVAFFDKVYRKNFRFCVTLISKEYAERIWTTHERRSATARALTEKGNSYILPVRIDDTDIDGLPPTVGHVSLRERTPAEIAELLVIKLRA